MENMTPRRVRPLYFGVALSVAFVVGGWSTQRSEITAPDGTTTVYAGVSTSALMAQVRTDLKDGEYLFLPNRRSIWVINQTNGRMAVYTFLNNEYDTVERSRVGQIDARAFPPGEVVFQISDKNLSNNLWVCSDRRYQPRSARSGRHRGNRRPPRPERRFPPASRKSQAPGIRSACSQLSCPRHAARRGRDGPIRARRGAKRRVVRKRAL